MTEKTKNNRTKKIILGAVAALIAGGVAAGTILTNEGEGPAGEAAKQLVPGSQH